MAGLAGALLAGNHWSGSRPLSAHRPYLTTQSHKACSVNRPGTSVATWAGEITAVGGRLVASFDDTGPEGECGDITFPFIGLFL